MEKLPIKYFWILILAFTLLWGFVYLTFLPGLSDNDGDDIFKMILGFDFTSDWFRYTKLNDHHTLLYVFFNWSIISVAKVFGASNIVAISCVCFIQMFVLIFSLSYSIKKIYEFSESKILLIVSLLFFLINPLIIQYSVSHWKDIIFGALILLICIKLIHLCCYYKDFKSNKLNLIALIMLLIVCTFWRKNAFLVTIIVLIILAIKFSDYRKIFTCTLICIISLGLLSSVAKDFAKIQKAHFSEAISIPLQQIAYTAKQNSSLEQTQEFFENILPIEEWKNLYSDNTPDPIKYSKSFNDEFLDSHNIEFLYNYLVLGLNHIPEYIYAWAKQTASFWNPMYGTWYTSSVGVNLGENNFLQYNFFDNLFYFMNLKNLLDIALIHWNPIYNNSILAWLSIIVFICCLVKKNENMAITILPLILLWVSLLFSTPGCDFRYVFPIHLSLPIIFLIAHLNFKRS